MTGSPGFRYRAYSPVTSAICIDKRKKDRVLWYQLDTIYFKWVADEFGVRPTLDRCPCLKQTVQMLLFTVNDPTVVGKDFFTQQTTNFVKEILWINPLLEHLPERITWLCIDIHVRFEASVFTQMDTASSTLFRLANGGPFWC